MKTILDSQTARMLMKEGGGFAVSVTVNTGPSLPVASYAPPTASLAANLKGERFQSYRAGWGCDYIVRVWPKKTKKDA